MMAASSLFTPKTIGASSTKAAISKEAGRKDISRAGRPTCFKSAGRSESPALIRMMTSAICRRSAEMPGIEPSSRFSACGPSKIPAASIPTMGGRRSARQTDAAARPARRIRASEVNIHISPFCRKKGRRLLRHHITEVISLHSGSGCPWENFIPVGYSTRSRVRCQPLAAQNRLICTASGRGRPAVPASSLSFGISSRKGEGSFEVSSTSSSFARVIPT